MIFKKLLSAVLVLLFFVNSSLPLLADETTPTPTPEQEATSEATIEINETYEASNSALFTLSPEGTSEGSINTGNGSEITTTDSTVNNVAIQNDNSFQGTITTDDSSITGDNTADKNISFTGAVEVKSGDATVIQNLQNIINTNIVGSNAFVSLLNIFETSGQNIDLSMIQPCRQNGQITTSDIPLLENSGNSVTVLDSQTDRTLFNVTNNNEVDINNTVDALAQTGNNEAIENIAQGTRVETGDASIDVNLFTMANTNLVGDCFYFGIINLFGEFTGDIILPYELEIINGPSNQSGAGPQSTLINTGDDLSATNTASIQNILAARNNNNASVSTIINTDANTGKNTLSDTISFSEGGFIDTGNANTVTNILDMVNTNIVGSRFIVIQINRLSEWVGSVIGTLETFIVEPKYLLLYEKRDTTLNTGDNVDILSQQELLSMLSVTNDNTATVENTLNLTADTGNNTAGRFNASITTGNADINADVFNLINTNIVGNNWMYIMINVFDKFVGNIVLSRADLSVTKSTTAQEVQRGDIITYRISVKNNGQIPAEHVGIDDVLPSGVEFVSATFSPEVNGTTLTWRLGTIGSGQSRDIYINVRIRDSIDGTAIRNSASAFTTTAESSIDNNISSSTVHYKNRPAPQSSSSSSPSSSSSSSSASSSGSSGSNTNSLQQSFVLGKKMAPLKKTAAKKKVFKKPLKKAPKKAPKKIQKPAKKPVKSIKKSLFNLKKFLLSLPSVLG